MRATGGVQLFAGLKEGVDLNGAMQWLNPEGFIKIKGVNYKDSDPNGTYLRNNIVLIQCITCSIAVRLFRVIASQFYRESYVSRRTGYHAERKAVSGNALYLSNIQ